MIMILSNYNIRLEMTPLKSVLRGDDSAISFLRINIIDIEYS